ncbi:DUF1189 domain-containing protein [Pseudalkalibacillus sp. SCS-8]|uniref:DUF1189 domain-containing protein n=1 Tax=Pseudalkalibacillus nanhaiensis TaxID=3115291 RepID=UPI0032DBEC3C
MNIFKQFATSLYSPQQMATFRFQKIGKTIGYVFIMMLIAFIFIGTNIGVTISGMATSLDKVLNEDVPDFTFKDGTLTSDMEEPIKREIDGETFIFDTTNTVTRDDLEQYNNVMAILSDKTIIITEGSAETFDYMMMKDMTFKKSDITGFVESANNLLPLIITVVIIAAYIFMTALKFIGVTVLALIGLIVKNIMKRNLSYRQLWILSAYAVTLPTIFFALLESLNIMVPGQFLLYWIAAITMLSLTVKNVPAPKTTEE